MATNIKPLHDRVIVRRIEEGEQVRGGIIIPDTAKEKPQEGEVVAAGEGKYREDGTRQTLDVKKGDRVLGGAFGLLRGWEVCSILYLALTAFPVKISSVTEARTAPILAQGAKMLGIFTSQEMRTRFYESYSNLFTGK